MLKSLVAPAIGACELAGSVCGIPYIQAAATLLHSINTACNQFAVHRKTAEQLIYECTLLLNVLNDYATGIAGTDIGFVADEVMAVLEIVHGRVQKWASYSKIESYMKMSQIQDGLDQRTTEVKCAYQKFNLDSALLMHRNQQQTMQMIQAQSAGVNNALLDILTNQQEMARRVQNTQTGNGPSVYRGHPTANGPKVGDKSARGASGETKPWKSKQPWQPQPHWKQRKAGERGQGGKFEERGGWKRNTQESQKTNRSDERSRMSQSKTAPKEKERKWRSKAPEEKHPKAEEKRPAYQSKTVPKEHQWHNKASEDQRL